MPMTRIITDSTCDLTLEELAEHNIEMLSLGVDFGNEHYLDKITITNKEFYEKLRQAKEVPTTCLLNPDQFLALFDRYPDDDLIVITLAAELSGTYQSAVIAKKLSDRQNIHLIDSRTVTTGLGLLVLKAARLRDEGKTAAEIVQTIKADTKKVRIVAVLDTVEYLVKGGRMKAVTGFMAGALKIKPIILIMDGIVRPLSKARGSQSAFRELQRIITEIYPVDWKEDYAFAHTDDEQMLCALMETLGKQGRQYLLGSVVGTHGGPGAVAIAYFEK